MKAGHRGLVAEDTGDQTEWRRGLHSKDPQLSEHETVNHLQQERGVGDGPRQARLVYILVNIWLHCKGNWVW